MLHRLRYDHHSDFGGHLSPSLSLGFKKNEKTNFYFNYKEFFVAPNLYQLNAAYYGNKNLDPEEGYTFEFGVNHEFDDTLSVHSIFSASTRKTELFMILPLPNMPTREI
ncbi:MAG: TonB-dependent receptor domain-containing protein [Dialister invisus]